MELLSTSLVKGLVVSIADANMRYTSNTRRSRVGGYKVNGVIASIVESRFMLNLPDLRTQTLEKGVDYVIGSSIGLHRRGKVGDGNNGQRKQQ